MCSEKGDNNLSESPPPRLKYTMLLVFRNSSSPHRDPPPLTSAVNHCVVILILFLIIPLLRSMVVPLLCFSLTMHCPLLTQLGLCLLLSFLKQNRICDLFNAYCYIQVFPVNSEQMPIIKPGHRFMYRVLPSDSTRSLLKATLF